MGMSIFLIFIAAVALVSIMYLAYYEKIKDSHLPGILFLIKKKSKVLNKKDYNTYQMSHREWMGYTTQAALFLFLLGYVCYRSVVLGLLLTPLSMYYPKIKRKELIQKNKLQLNIEFKDGLYAISASLAAGKSIEGAIRDAVKDLTLQYCDRDALIIRELESIILKIEMNITVEAAFADLASFSHLDDIQSFVDVFVTCNRTGGNLVEVMKNTSKIIAEKMDFQQELELLLAQRKFEQKMLMIIPLVLLVGLSWSAADYMEPVFTTLIGRIVMSIALLLMGLAVIISKKLMNIEV